MRIPALKDRDGDYWIKYGVSGDDMVCLASDPEVRCSYIDTTGAISADLLASSDFIPLTAVHLDIIEVEVTDISRVCDACLYDRHFCEACGDAVSHNHMHEEG